MYRTHIDHEPASVATADPPYGLWRMADTLRDIRESLADAARDEHLDGVEKELIQLATVTLDRARRRLLRRS